MMPWLFGSSTAIWQAFRLSKSMTILTPNGKSSQGAHRALAVGTLAAFLAAWVFLRPAYLPSPLEVAQAFPQLVLNGLLTDLEVSLATNLQAIAISCAIVIPLSYLTTLPVVRPFVRGISKARFLGLTGFTVVFAVVFGGGHALKLALLVVGMSTFMVTSLYDVVESVPREEFDYARTLGMGPWRSVYEIVVLGKLDIVIEIVRQNAAVSWMMLTFVEGLVRFEGGLGASILTQDKHLHFDTVFALQGVILLVGILQDSGFVALKKILCPYASLSLERR